MCVYECCAIYVHIWVDVHVCIHVCGYGCMQATTYIHACMYVCMHVCMYVCMYVRMMNMQYPCNDTVDLYWGIYSQFHVPSVCNFFFFKVTCSPNDVSFLNVQNSMTPTHLDDISPLRNPRHSRTDSNSSVAGGEDDLSSSTTCLGMVGGRPRARSLR